MEIELGEIQEKFAKLLWEKEPIASGEVVRLALEQFEWKKSTRYTVLRKLCEKGLFLFIVGIVTSVVSEEEFERAKSHKFVEDNFDGSLPSFIAAFAGRKKLSGKEVEEIQEMIARFQKGE